MSKKQALVVAQPKLPSLRKANSAMLEQVTAALGVPRSVLASDEEIENAWSQLPRQLEKIPKELRSELHVRMCVAVSTGLFDSAISYAWNSAIIQLRDKVRRFGLPVVQQIIGKEFDDANLLDLKDSELLDLCLKLNLIGEEGHFLLGQCREVRNNFSAAHPPMGAIDDAEFLNFLSRCAKYAFDSEFNPEGVDTHALLQALRAGRFNDDQVTEWSQRLHGTHDAQRQLVFGMLHGIYCDPDSQEDVRLNALDLCREFKDEFSSASTSELINRHSNYIAEGKTDRQKASQAFFRELGILSILSTAEQHTLISSACSKLWSVHEGFDNFYNEPPFARTLAELTTQTAVPASAQREYVETVLGCRIGNTYGISRSARSYYDEMIQGFSPREVGFVFEIIGGKGTVAQRLRLDAGCRTHFKAALALIDPQSVSPAAKPQYDRWLYD